MRQGCLDFIFRRGPLVVVSAVLIAVGALLLLVGLLSSSPLSGARTALSIIAALVASYLFIRVGHSIWRDLREQQIPDQEKEIGDDAASKDE